MRRRHPKCCRGMVCHEWIHEVHSIELNNWDYGNRPDASWTPCCKRKNKEKRGQAHNLHHLCLFNVARTLRSFNARCCTSRLYARMTCLACFVLPSEDRRSRTTTVKRQHDVWRRLFWGQQRCLDFANPTVPRRHEEDRQSREPSATSRISAQTIGTHGTTTPKWQRPYANNGSPIRYHRGGQIAKPYDRSGPTYCFLAHASENRWGHCATTNPADMGSEPMRIHSRILRFSLVWRQQGSTTRQFSISLLCPASCCTEQTL